MASNTHVKTPNDDVPLTAQCLCKAHKFTIIVPRTSLPLKATTCHCDSCRRFTGALYTIDAPWHGDFETIRQSTLKWYDFSPNLNILFCGACSSPMFWDSPLRDAETGGVIGRKFTVFVGALSNEGPEDLVEVGAHMFIGDTRDGGASMWMRGMNGDKAPLVRRFKGMKHESEELAEDWPGFVTKRNRLPGQEKQDEVPVRCHCGGVDLVFLRQEAEREFTAKKADDLPRLVDPVSRKYVAGLDACDSCRLSLGTDFSSWASVFLRHIAFPASKGQPEGPGDGRIPGPGFPPTLQDLHAAVSGWSPPLPPPGGKDARLGTLEAYRSSEGVTRYYCSHCSACVLYTDEGKHADAVDLAIGVVHAEEGARAEECFQWRPGGPIRHGDDMAGGWRGTWLKAVEDEEEAWRKARGFPEWWRQLEAKV